MRYMLRTCSANRTSYGGFVWPSKGGVVPFQFDPTPRPGGGLHGLLDGQGDPSLLDGPIWLVCEIEKYVQLSEHIKVPSANVVFCGTKDDAIAFLSTKVAEPDKIVHQKIIRGGDIHAGNCANIICTSDGSEVYAGVRANITVGNNCTVAAGIHSIVNALDLCNITVSRHSRVITGDNAVVSSGYGSIVHTCKDCIIHTDQNCTVFAGLDSRVIATVNNVIHLGMGSKLICGRDNLVFASNDTTVHAGSHSVVHMLQGEVTASGKVRVVTPTETINVVNKTIKVVGGTVL